MIALYLELAIRGKNEELDRIEQKNIDIEILGSVEVPLFTKPE